MLWRVKEISGIRNHCAKMGYLPSERVSTLSKAKESRSIQEARHLLHVQVLSKEISKIVLSMWIWDMK